MGAIIRNGVVYGDKIGSRDFIIKEDVAILKADNIDDAYYNNFIELYQPEDPILLISGDEIIFIKKVSNPIMNIRNSGSNNPSAYSVYINGEKFINSSTLPANTTQTVTINYNFQAGDTFKFHKDGIPGALCIDKFIFKSQQISVGNTSISYT